MKILLFFITLFPSLLFSQKTDSSQYYFKKGMDEKAARHYLVASGYFDKAISFNAKDVNAFIENGRANLEMRKITNAQSNFEKAYQLDPDNQVVIKELTSLYFDNHQFEKAIQFAQKCKDCTEGDKINAMSNYYLEDYNKAIPGLQRLIEKNPDNAELAYTLGKSFIEIDEYKKAVPYFEKAIALDSSQNSRIYELGLLYFNQDDFHNALKYFKIAADKGFIQSNDFTENMGYAYLYSGDFDNGIEYLNKVLAKKPNSKEVLNEIAFAYYKRQRYDDALNYYQQLMQKDSKDAKALYMAGMCFQKKGNTDKGQAMCDKAIEMDPMLKNLRQKNAQSFGL